MDSPLANEGLIFEAVLRPHRSLSRRALLGVVAGMVAASLCVTTLMYLLGAWPVVGFNGADLALVFLLFWLNARAARAREIIRLGKLGVQIIRITPGGAESRVTLSPNWARAELEERAGAVPRLIIRAQTVREEVGRQLGEAEKRDLAAALNRAFGRWHGAF